MFQLIFAILWTVVATTAIAFGLHELGPLERAVSIVVVVMGAFFVWISWRQLRRRRSLRVEEADGATWYVWIELDGTPRRSTRDPREDWDAEGGDGDGGDGGD